MSMSAGGDAAAASRAVGCGCCARRAEQHGGPERWQDVKPVEPGESLDAAWAGQFPLSTRGRHIVNRHGQRFRFKGVNWYGASDAYHVVGGLDVQSLDVICETVSTLGFTVVRLPFSNEMLRSPAAAPGAVDFGKNPNLRGLSALELLDEVVRALGRQRVAVVLNNHTTYGEWCYGPDRNGLWFRPGSTRYTEAQWVEDWAMLAWRYSRCPNVVGFDLRNEVRFCPSTEGSACSSARVRPVHWPSWGGGSNLARLLGGCDWAKAASLAAKRVLALNPCALIIVERIIWPQRSLRSYAKDPGPLLPDLQGHLVLGVHHYSWTGPDLYVAFGGPRSLRYLFSALRTLGLLSKKNYGDMDRAELFDQLEREWGFVLDADICPVWVSEFGVPLDNCKEMQWFERFTAFLAAKDADWAYWPLNVGPKPASGHDESYGLLAERWLPKEGGDRRHSLLACGGDGGGGGGRSTGL